MGSDEDLDNAHLMRMAGRFSRRVRAHAKAYQIPLVDCQQGERKHEIAEEYLPKDVDFSGVFLILVARAPAPVWDVQCSKSGKVVNLARKYPYVNHYSFHILDPDWGHVTIKMSGHPPFGAQVILNGHEYVACQARKDAIQFTKEGNSFTQISDATCQAQIADTLSSPGIIGRLTQALDNWPKPSFVGQTRVGGVNVNQPRMQAVIEDVIALAAAPQGFHCADLAEKVQNNAIQNYTPRQAAYDLKKLCGKNLSAYYGVKVFLRDRKQPHKHISKIRCFRAAG